MPPIAIKQLKLRPSTLVAPPYRCGTLTHDNRDMAPHRAVRGLIPETTGLNWRGDVTWTSGGTAIIRGEKPDLEPNDGGDR